MTRPAADLPDRSLPPDQVIPGDHARVAVPPNPQQEAGNDHSAKRKYPCEQCGAKLDFDPAVQSLHCPYCGFQKAIEQPAQGVEERDWDQFWSQQTTHEEQLPEHASEVVCTACGAVVILDDKIVTDACPYCARHLENEPQAARSMILPGAILPFAITRQQAIASFTEWLQSRWFAPSQLKNFSNLGKLSGVYLPYWTFDSMTDSHYKGMRGDDYTEIEHYMDHETHTQTDAHGNTTTTTHPVMKTRTVTKTSWSSASGEVNHFFNDLLVCASTTLPAELIAQLEPWDLPSLVEFRAEYLSGFQTERYTVGLKEGFFRAEAMMEPQIKKLCCQDIGGDHQTISFLKTDHTEITFKHLLLPVWVAAFRFRDQPFRILINARTGEVVGTRPYSFAKITFLVLGIIAAVALVAFIIAAASSR